METGRLSTPPSQEISKKHKLPAVMLPPPNQRQQAQLVQTVAPLMPNNPEAEEPSTIHSIDLSMPPPILVPEDLSEAKAIEAQAKMVQLDKYEKMLLNAIRRNKISPKKLLEFISSINPINQTEEEYPPKVCESVLKKVEAYSESNKTALMGLINLSEKKIDDMCLEMIRKQLKEEILAELRELLKKEINERFYNYSTSRYNRSMEDAPPPVIKKLKKSHPHQTQKQVHFVGDINRAHPDTLESSTKRPYLQHQQQQRHQQPAQRNASAPGNTEPTETQGEIVCQNQYYAMNQVSQRHEQNPEVQVQIQDFQQGEWNFQQPQWGLDSRIKMHLMRSMQPSHTMPNTHWGHTYYNSHGQQ